MKIFSAEEIRNWDQYTIEHEPVSSINLMERAASQCVDWLEKNIYLENSFSIFCGKGNNGGDGLAIARLLAMRRAPVTVHILEFGHKGTADFQINLARLHEFPQVQIRFLQSEEQFPEFHSDSIIIDALYGSGLNRGLEAVTADLVKHINQSGCEIISIDIPSGLFVDRSSVNNIIVKANHTLTFQCYKLAFLVAENKDFIGKVHLLDIRLHPDFTPSTQEEYVWVDTHLINEIYRPRNPFAHKGNFGHSLLLAGSHGKIGAAILAARACLRSGTGLLTCHLPSVGYPIIQAAVPEAMAISDPNMDYSTRIDDGLDRYASIGAGPGIGQAEGTKKLLKELLNQYKKPVVLDADALNIISEEKDLIKIIPPGSILTPHPKEFERLFGKTENDFERIKLALQMSDELKLVIVLKGHHTLISSPEGKAKAFFNSTGNAGLAKGGSGDVLTGIITGLLAQGYSSTQAAILGVYLHGLAADMAVINQSQEAMLASDIIDHLGNAFIEIGRAAKWDKQSGQ